MNNMLQQVSCHCHRDIRVLLCAAETGDATGNCKSRETKLDGYLVICRKNLSIKDSIDASRLAAPSATKPACECSSVILFHLQA
jgi:hypothetical protein